MTPIVTAGGERLGLFFEGAGKLLMRVTDPHAVAVFAENARLADKIADQTRRIEAMEKLASIMALLAAGAK